MEKIVAAAIHTHGITLSAEKPGRHHTVLHAMSKQLGLDAMELGHPDAQGFLTSNGRYVDRIEGADIAIKSEQIDKLNWPPYLYSEDLW